MKFRVGRKELLRPLELVSGVVEGRAARSTMTILKNVRLALEEGKLTLTGTDLEVQWIGSLDVAEEQPGETTVPAQKLLAIARELPDGAEIECSLSGDNFQVKSGSFQSSLSALPADDFPNVDALDEQQQITLKASVVRRLIDRISFSMAQQDVRYYLNGALLELTSEHVRLVATNGHRLAMSDHKDSLSVLNQIQVILPRRGVTELRKLVGDGNKEAKIAIGSNHFQACYDGYTLTSKLVDGKYPDYTRVMPEESNRILTAERDQLRDALKRTAILANEKYKSVRLGLQEGDGRLHLSTNNPEQEKAEDTIDVEYAADTVEVGFNFAYLLDVLGVLDGKEVKIMLSQENGGALISEPGDAPDSKYIVMPMKL